MKARNFRYIRPTSIDDAYRILAENEGEAVPLAGGQSLLATLNLRLSSPKILVDLSGSEGADRSNLSRMASCASARSRCIASYLSRNWSRSTFRYSRALQPISGTSQSAIAGRWAAASPMLIQQQSCRPAPWCWARRSKSAVLRASASCKAEEFLQGFVRNRSAPKRADPRGAVSRSSKRTPRSGLPSWRAGTATSHSSASPSWPPCSATASVNARLAYFGPVDRARLAHSVSSAVEGLALPLRDSAPFEAAILEGSRARGHARTPR